MPRKAPNRKRLENKLDEICSKYIKTRDKWTCQRCRKQYPKGSQGLHWSHFYSRRHRSVRWDASNSCCHCYYCHSFLGGNPVLFRDWIVGYLGDKEAEKLAVKAMTTTKWSLADLEYLYAEFEERLKALEAA